VVGCPGRVSGMTKRSEPICGPVSASVIICGTGARNEMAGSPAPSPVVAGFMSRTTCVFLVSGVPARLADLALAAATAVGVSGRFPRPDESR
jgi:hypothetical protein